jgi:hypothetical protein
MNGATIGKGLVAGAAGGIVMTIGEKLEQRLTKRPNSFVPAHTLERLLGLPRKPDAERHGLNLLMHFGQGMLAGVVRAALAERGVRGPFAAFMFLGMRLALDQTLENATGVGAPPWTWEPKEQVVDLLHKAVFAVATSVVADRLVSPRRPVERTFGW